VAICPVTDGQADDTPRDGDWDTDTLQTTSASLKAYRGHDLTEKHLSGSCNYCLRRKTF